MATSPANRQAGARAGGGLANALWVARRYLFARENAHATFINWTSFVGLALGVMALTSVASVMNGFDRELKARLLGATPHAVLIPPENAAMSTPRTPPGARSVARFFGGAAMLTGRGAMHPVALHAVDASGVSSLDLVARSVVEGSLEALFQHPGGIALGAPLARAFGIAVGDPVLLALMAPDAGGPRPVLARFTLRATFELGAQPDYSLAVAALDDLARRNLTAGGEIGWRVQFFAPMAALGAAPAWRASLPDGWKLRTWAETHGDLFRAVGLEKTLMFATLALVIAIAAFNIVSGQTMLVSDKRPDVAMLATMGAPARFIAEVFRAQGFAVAIAGVGVGLLTGVLIAWNAGPVAAALSALAGGSILEGSAFDELPSQVLVSDLAIIAALSLGLCFLAVLRPALQAAAENPAAALHGG